ncbi:MAG: hypothetical protein OEY05_06665, partial [Paracoccaceae bacterium]|nr:hypothetical protein [Paracoccaceae bacterium]
IGILQCPTCTLIYIACHQNPIAYPYFSPKPVEKSERHAQDTSSMEIPVRVRREHDGQCQKLPDVD